VRVIEIASGEWGIAGNLMRAEDIKAMSAAAQAAE
jgi:hypothetical protein